MEPPPGPGPEFLIIEGGFIIEFRDPNSLITGGGGGGL